MLRVRIDDNEVVVPPGTRILDAARIAGIRIPTLCDCSGIKAPLSCFVCVVRVKGRDGFVPSCAVLAEEGMEVECSTEEVGNRRRQALELLMSEHAGDCEAPCMRICPANIDIPEIMRCMNAGDQRRAMETFMAATPFPAVLGHICPAPCEKGCRRKQVDTPLAIRRMHLYATQGNPEYQAYSEASASTGKRVVIVGAGPAGLSAAYYCARNGHACTVFDKNSFPGGALRYGVDRALLPEQLLDQEIARILARVDFVPDREITSLEEIDGIGDAVVLATGDAVAENVSGPLLPNGKLPCTAEHIHSSGRPGIFVCGNAPAGVHLAARAVGRGRATAMKVHDYLMGEDGASYDRERYDSRAGKVAPNELLDFNATVGTIHAFATGKKEPESVHASEAGRCLLCDCAKKERCDLRRYAREYRAGQRYFFTAERKTIVRKVFGSGLVFEPGKCITCGKCVGITTARNIIPGLAFLGRGSRVEVGAPFKHHLDEAMGGALDDCVAACPTGALWKCTRETPC